MFGKIAGRYDLLNHVLSGNLDRGWRRAATRELPPSGVDRVLDLCGGTGDLTLALARSGRARSVVCCDFAHPMLTLAGEKFVRREVANRCLLVEADGLRLPFADASFDAVTVGFGVRNLADLGTGFREILRVLRPGGLMVVLEFSTPSGRAFSRLYHLYLRRILPWIGDGISGRDGAYRYLATTISEFPDPPTLAERVRESGFAACNWRRLTGGIVAIHTGHKAK